MALVGEVVNSLLSNSAGLAEGCDQNPPIVPPSQIPPLVAPKRKAPAVDMIELRSRARSTAMRIAERHGLDPDLVYSATDTVAGLPCFVVTNAEAKGTATIVYEREPMTRVDIMSWPGRLIQPARDRA